MRRTPAQHTQGRSVYLLFEEDHHLAEDSRPNRLLRHADNTFTNLSPNENSSMKNMIDDAIYSASPEIACRRYNPSLGIVLTAGSIALLWANSHVSLFTENDMLSQWNLLISSCILCTGIVMICYRVARHGRRREGQRTGERLYRSEYSFEAHDLPKVQSAIECGNFAVLQNLPRSYQPAAQVICYRTDSGSLIAAQVLMNRQPTGEIKVFRAGEYDF